MQEYYYLSSTIVYDVSRRSSLSFLYISYACSLFVYLYSYTLLFVCFILYQCNIPSFLLSLYIKCFIWIYHSCLTVVCSLTFYYCDIMLFFYLRYMILSQVLCAIVGGIQWGGDLLSFIYNI